MTAPHFIYESEGIAYHLPQQLPVVRAVQQACPGSDPDMQQIAQLIGSDQAVAQYLLHRVNSPLFKLSNPVTTVQHAVNLLGATHVINLINGISLRVAMEDCIQSEHLGGFWSTAHQEAMVCAAIAERIEGLSSDEAYLLGLFHDSGIPILLHTHPDYLNRIRKAQHRSERFICEIEMDYFGCHHAVLSYQIAVAWQVPQNICDAILMHHDIDIVIGMLQHHNPVRGLWVAVLLLAEYICDKFRHQWRLLENNIIGDHLDILITRLGFNELSYNEFVLDVIQSLRQTLRNGII